MKSPRVRPTRQETVEQLLDGAMQAFAERGFHGARQEDICAKAGLSRGAFYSSFASKDDLFLMLYDRVMGDLATTLDRALTMDANSSTEPLAAFLDVYIRDNPLNRDWYLLNTEFTLYAIRHPATAARLAQRRAELRRLLVDRLANFLARQGRVPVGDPDMTARILIALAEGGLAQHLIEPGAVAPTDLLAELLPVILTARARPMAGWQPSITHPPSPSQRDDEPH